ncbi:MAG TPA: hypothetical protein VJQ56_04635 [Blastocatellia bacterium]|nr:hypothetical protein [Blastocatellia bacterium]
MSTEVNNEKCARATCSCPPEPGRKYCSDDCEEVGKMHLMEIACACHHPACG